MKFHFWTSSLCLESTTIVQSFFGCFLSRYTSKFSRNLSNFQLAYNTLHLHQKLVTTETYRQSHENFQSKLPYVLQFMKLETDLQCGILLQSKQYQRQISEKMLFPRSNSSQIADIYWQRYMQRKLRIHLSVGLVITEALCLELIFTKFDYIFNMNANVRASLIQNKFSNAVLLLQRYARNLK